MSMIDQLKHAEAVRLDRDQLETLFVQMGPQRADKEINQSLEDLAVALARVQKANQRGEIEDMQAGVRDLIRVAQKVGMVTLARVARDVLDLSKGTDGVAFAACLARLERIGEGSLIAVWDLQDMTL
ncbi:hypothetical protein [Aliiroseovarius marinus]|uniref:hypothetical protein n=1 Tax=Aliiroseovarius marinus TaxID=2500159 RepID=UPI003D7EC528